MKIDRYKKYDEFEQGEFNFHVGSDIKTLKEVLVEILSNPSLLHTLSIKDIENYISRLEDE